MSSDEFALAQRAVEALERIAASVEILAASVIAEEPPAPEPPAETCPHPAELRISFGTTDGRPDWQCGVPGCGYRSLAEPREVKH